MTFTWKGPLRRALASSPRQKLAWAWVESWTPSLESSYSLRFLEIYLLIGVGVGRGEGRERDREEREEVLY